jgi:hypothetical protein
MKKIMLTLAMAVAIISTGFSRNASYSDPGAVVKQAFTKEFSQITHVTWDLISKEGIYEAAFTFNNELVKAYFSDEGEFLGTIREVTKSQLPILVVKEMDQRFPDAKVAAVYEHSMKDGLNYYITILTEKGVLILKATGNGELTVHKRATHKL